MITDVIRYNSLRSLADLTIDYNGEDYLAAGVTCFPAGGLTFPPVNGNPSRIFIKADLLRNALPHLQRIPNAFHLLTGSSDIPAWVILPFCKGVRSRNAMQPWPASALV